MKGQRTETRGIEPDHYIYWRCKACGIEPVRRADGLRASTHRETPVEALMGVNAGDERISRSIGRTVPLAARTLRSITRSARRVRAMIRADAGFQSPTGFSVRLDNSSCNDRPHKSCPHSVVSVRCTGGYGTSTYPDWVTTTRDLFYSLAECIDSDAVDEAVDKCADEVQGPGTPEGASGPSKQDVEQVAEFASHGCNTTRDARLDSDAYRRLRRVPCRGGRYGDQARLLSAGCPQYRDRGFTTLQQSGIRYRPPAIVVMTPKSPRRQYRQVRPLYQASRYPMLPL